MNKFFVGDKVVAVDDSGCGYKKIAKGEIYTVAHVGYNERRRTAVYYLEKIPGGWHEFRFESYDSLKDVKDINETDIQSLIVGE